MRELTWTTVPQSPEVSLHVATFMESLQTAGFVHRLLLALHESPPEYHPDSFRGTFFDERDHLREVPPTPLREDTFPVLVRALGTPQLGNVMLTRGDPPTFTVALPTRFRTGIRHHYVHLFIGRELVGTRHSRQGFLEVAQRLFLICEGFFGDLGTFRHLRTEPVEGAPGMHRLVAKNLARGLPPPDWGLLLGPAYVALLGADRIRRAPCEVIREFETGHFLLLLAEDFETLDADENILEGKRQRLVEHFGPEYFSYVRTEGSKIVLPQLRQGTTDRS